jgi:DNA-binding CsgD family transcriptional regulator
MAKEVKINEECCLTCANLLECPDILTYQCKRYSKGVLKEGLTKEYADQLNKAKTILNDLVVAVNTLVLLETEQKIAQKVEENKPKEKIAISKRNKEIIELVKQGKGVKEMATSLKLEPETVEKELEYLLKAGLLKQVTTADKITNSEVVLKREGSKVIVLKPAA